MERSARTGCPEYVEDISKDKFNDEAFCRDYYTSHESITIKPLEEVVSKQQQAPVISKARQGSSSSGKPIRDHASSKKARWEKVTVSKNFLAEQDMQHKILLLNKKRSVVDRRNELFNNQEMQVTRVLAAENRQETDRAFVWTLAQLDRKLSDKNSKGERRTLALTVYLRRAPRPKVDCIVLHERLTEEARRLQRPATKGNFNTIRSNAGQLKHSVQIPSTHRSRATITDQNDLYDNNDRGWQEAYSYRGEQQGYLAKDEQQSSNYASRGSQMGQYAGLSAGINAGSPGPYGSSTMSDKEQGLPVYGGDRSNQPESTAHSQRQSVNHSSPDGQSTSQGGYASWCQQQMNTPSRPSPYGTQNPHYDTGSGTQSQHSGNPMDQGHRIPRPYPGTARPAVGNDTRDRSYGNVSMGSTETTVPKSRDASNSGGGNIAPGIQIISQEPDSDSDSESDSSRQSGTARDMRARSRQPSVRPKVGTGGRHASRRRSHSLHRSTSSSTNASSEDLDSDNEGDTTPTSSNSSTRQWGNVHRRVPQGTPNRSRSTKQGTARRLSTSRTRYNPSIQQVPSRTSRYPVDEVRTGMEALLSEFARVMPVTTRSTRSRSGSDSLNDEYYNVHNSTGYNNREAGKAQDRRLSALEEEMVRSRARERAMLEAQRRQQENDLRSGSTASMRQFGSQKIPRYTASAYPEPLDYRDEFDRGEEAYRSSLSPLSPLASFSPPTYRNPFMPL